MYRSGRDMLCGYTTCRRTNQIESKYNRDNGEDAVPEHLTRAQRSLWAFWKRKKRENLYSTTKIILICFYDYYNQQGKENKYDNVFLFSVQLKLCIYRTDMDIPLNKIAIAYPELDWFKEITNIFQIFFLLVCFGKTSSKDLASGHRGGRAVEHIVCVSNTSNSTAFFSTLMSGILGYYSYKDVKRNFPQTKEVNRISICIKEKPTDVFVFKKIQNI